MTKIDGSNRTQMVKVHEEEQKKPGNFRKVMGGVADGTLATVSSLGKSVPGGQVIAAVADGLRSLKNGAPDLSSGQDQIDKMFAMQRESQMFNLQYLQLQTEIQADNRNFSTLSNLMKVRHDTAKSAINNMHV